MLDIQTPTEFGIFLNEAADSVVAFVEYWVVEDSYVCESVVNRFLIDGEKRSGCLGGTAPRQFD